MSHLRASWIAEPLTLTKPILNALFVVTLLTDNGNVTRYVIVATMLSVSGLTNEGVVEWRQPDHGFVQEGGKPWEIPSTSG